LGILEFYIPKKRPRVLYIVKWQDYYFKIRFPKVPVFTSFTFWFKKPGNN
jgi:uncharacterized protein Usg